MHREGNRTRKTRKRNNDSALCVQQTVLETVTFIGGTQ